MHPNNGIKLSFSDPTGLILYFVIIFKNMKYINIGNKPNSGDADTMREAFNKVNDNFAYIQSKIDKDLDFINIEWKSIEDNLQCYKDINRNFEKLK